MNATYTAILNVKTGDLAILDDLNGPEYQPHYPEGARVTIEMAGGQRVTDFLGAPTGMPANPMTDDQLAAKFHNCTMFAGWTEQQSRSVLSGLWDLENRREIAAVIKGEMVCATP